MRRGPRRRAGGGTEVDGTEAAVTRDLFLLAACSGLVRVFFLSAAIPIFLERFSLADLPYTYAGAAILSAGVGLLRGRLERRLSFRTLSMATAAFVVVYCVLLRLGLELPGRTPAFLVAVSIDVIFVVTGLAMWGVANRVLDVRQAKRLFGRIGSGEVLAGFLGGLTAPLIVGLGGTPSLLVACAVSAALGLVVVSHVLRISDAKLSSQEPADDEAAAVPLRTHLRDRYVILVVAYSALCTLCFYFVDAGFVAAADSQHPEADSLSSFLGVFQAGVALATVATQLLLIGPLLRRFGVRVYLLLTPALVLAMTTGVILTGGLGGRADLVVGFMYATKFAMGLGWIAFFPSSKLLVLQPLQSSARTSVQTVVDAIVEGSAAGVAGLLLLLLSGVVPFTPEGLALLVAPALIAFLVVGTLLGRQYAGRLERAVAVRALPDASIALTDPATLRVLVAGLDSERPEQVLYCIDRLDEADHPQYADLLVRLAHHPAGEVRTDALLRIERLVPAGALDAVEKLLAVERDPHLVGIAMRTLSAVGGEAVVARVALALEDPSPAVRAGAMQGLLLYGGETARPAARARLLRLGADELPENRALAARVMGEVDSEPFDPLLGRLLDDPDPDVRRAALEAAGRLGRPAFWPAMLASLVSSAGGGAAAALTEIGDPVVPFLDEALSDAHGVARASIVGVCSAISGTRAADLLERAADDADPHVRVRALRSLAERGWRLPDSRAEGLLDDECTMTSWLVATRREIERTAAAPILVEAVAAEIALSKERLLLVLAAMYDGSAMRRAHDAYTSGGAEERAYALELLDVSLSSRHKPKVLHLLEDRGSESPVRLDRELAPMGGLGELLCRPSLEPWTKACAIYSSMPIAADGLAAVRGALDSPHAIVRETAEWALSENRRENHMLTVEKTLLLRRTSMFADVPGHVLARVAEVVDHVVLPTDAVVMRQGETGSSMFVIAEGRVKVEVDGIVIATLGAGDVIGELATLDPQPRTATVVATEESTLLRLKRSALFELMAERVEVAHAIVRFLIHRYTGESSTHAVMSEGTGAGGHRPGDDRLGQEPPMLAAKSE